MEMALHGRVEYDKWARFLQGAEHKQILGNAMISIPDFETQFLKTCDEDMFFSD
jgi:hypothetical protein